MEQTQEFEQIKEIKIDDFDESEE